MNSVITVPSKKYHGDDYRKIALIDYPYFVWLLENIKAKFSDGAWHQSDNLRKKLNNFDSYKKSYSGKPAVKIAIPINVEKDYDFSDVQYLGEKEFAYVEDRKASVSFNLKFDTLLCDDFNNWKANKNCKQDRQRFTEILIECATGSKINLEGITNDIAIEVAKSIREPSNQLSLL